MGQPTDQELELFWRKVAITEHTEDCWLWLASTGGNGYGKHRWRTKLYQAHRFSYFASTGDMPESSLHVDHLCHNKGCVNPFHLQPVTARTNTLRAIRLGAFNAKARTTCSQGHDLTLNENKRILSNGLRVCLICEQANKPLIDFRKDRPDICKHGHPYTPENTLHNKKGARLCRECNRQRCKANRQRNALTKAIDNDFLPY